MNWFFRHSISHELGYDPFAIPNMGSNTDTDVNQFVIGNTQTIGTNKLNDLRIGYGNLKNAHISPRANVENVVGALGINIPSDNPLYWGVPNIGVTGLSGLGEESDAPFINDDKTIQFVDNFSWILGNHSVKFGGEIRRVLYDQIGGVVTRGRFNFDGTLYAAAAAAGGAARRRAFADFLLGHFNNAESQIGAPIADFRSNYYALYIQDNWKVTPNLTLDVGLRWEYDQPFTDLDDKIVNIDYAWDNSHAPVFVRAGTGDPYEGNPPFKLASNIPYVRDGRFGRGAYKPDYNDIAPRLGLAWSVNPKTVVRAGGGIYYVRDIGNAVFDLVRNAPFTIRNNEPAETFRPNLSFEQPFARTGSPTFILAAEYDMPSAYVAQWSLGFQRELPGSISAEVTYFGSAGVHLRRLQTYNNTEPSALSDTNLSRPFPTLGGMQVMNAPSHSKYNALYIKTQKRFSQGISFLSSFSYGKSIDNGSGVRTIGRRPADAVEQLRPRARDRAVGVRLPEALDDVVDLGTAVRSGSALHEPRRRRRLRARRLAAWRHPDAAGWLPVHRELQHGHRAERRRRLLSRPRDLAARTCAAARRRAQPHALVQYGRICRSRIQPVRHWVPLWHGEAQLGRRAWHQELRPVDQQELPGSAAITSSSVLRCSIFRTCRSGVSRARNSARRRMV